MYQNTCSFCRKLCQEGQLSYALQSADCMVQQGHIVSSSIAFCLIQGCIEKKDLLTGKELYFFLTRNGLLSNAFIACHLIRMFAACGSLLEALYVFSHIQQQNVFTWTAIISAHVQLGCEEQAVRLYWQMYESCVKADKYLFVTVLKACSSIAALSHGMFIHNHILESSLELDLFVGGALVDMYARCGSLENGQVVLHSLPSCDAVKWNAILGGFVQHGYDQEALLCFKQMQQQGTEPDDRTFVCVLKACCKIGALQKGELIHANVVESGIELDAFVGSTLIDMYSKCDRLDEAQNVFDHQPKHDLVTWNAMFTGFVQHALAYEAFQLFEQMQREGLEPNASIFVSVIKSCSMIAADPRNNLVYGSVVEAGYDFDICVGSMLVDMYGKFGALKEAQRVFDGLRNRTSVTWSAMIAGYSHYGFGEEALCLLEQMLQEGLILTSVTFIFLLRACSSITSLFQGKRVHAYIIESGCEVDAYLGVCLIDMYVSCVSLESACLVFEKLKTQTVETWSAIITGCAQHGEYIMASRYYSQMRQSGAKPDEITLISLLSACSHAGQLDEGCDIFRSLVDQYKITPTVDHYNCMVNLFGHVGFLKEAEDLLQAMPYFPNIVGWTALLSYCKICNNLELGRRCFARLIVMDCEYITM